MNNKATAPLVVLILLLSGRAASAAPRETPAKSKETVMTKKDELLRKIEALLAAKTLTQQSVSKALGTKFNFEDASEDEDSKDVEAHGRPGEPIEAVDLRGEPGRFLVLNVSPALGITLEDIQRRFGKSAGTHAPGPHAPPDDPWYQIYPKKDQELRFGMKPGSPPILVEVVIDRTEDR